MSAKINFDVNNDDNFYRWASPIILYIVNHGDVMPPSRSQLHREAFRKVLERMWATPFQQLLSSLDNEYKLQVAKYQTCEETRDMVDGIAWSWPEILTQVLETGVWYPELGPWGSGR